MVCRGWSKVNMAFLFLGVGGFLSHQGFWIGRGSSKIILTISNTMEDISRFILGDIPLNLERLGMVFS